MALTLAWLLISSTTAFAQPRTTITLWYWDRSIDDSLIAQVDQHVPGVNLVAEKIGGDYAAKLKTSLAGGSAVPCVVGLNSDISVYFPDAFEFDDLRRLGVGTHMPDYLRWKWRLATAPGGQVIGYPMDIGPTALFYRADLFRKAGLPTDPSQVAALTSTWQDYLQLGRRFEQREPQVHYLDDITNVFGDVMGQSPTQFMTPNGTFIGGDATVHRAFDLAAEAHQYNLSANETFSVPDWNAAVANGAIASIVGAVWEKDIIEQAAPNTSGDWRVAPAPGGAGNSGGSFLGITRYCSAPEQALRVIEYLQSPQAQLTSYRSIDLFPSAPADYASKAMNQPEPFFGGENTNRVFAAAAKQVKPAYFSPYVDRLTTIYDEELTDVETTGLSPEQAWQTTLMECRRELSH